MDLPCGQLNTPAVTQSQKRSEGIAQNNFEPVSKGINISGHSFNASWFTSGTPRIRCFEERITEFTRQISSGDKPMPMMLQAWI